MACRIVHLVEPSLCLSCRFATVTDLAGTQMIACTRGDCDNWEEVETTETQSE